MTSAILDRVESTRAARIALAYWRATAYDAPDERAPTKWAMLGLVTAALGVALGVTATIASFLISSWFVLPPPDSTMGRFFDIAPSLSSLAVSMMIALTVMYIGKLVAAVAAVAAEERGEDA